MPDNRCPPCSGCGILFHAISPHRTIPLIAWSGVLVVIMVNIAYMMPTDLVALLARPSPCFGRVLARIESISRSDSSTPLTVGRSAVMQAFDRTERSIATFIWLRKYSHKGSSALRWRSDFGASFAPDWNSWSRLTTFNVKSTSWTILKTTATTPSASAMVADWANAGKGTEIW